VLKSEVQQSSPFDPMSLRDSMWKSNQSGEADAVAYSVPNAKVIIVSSKKNPAIPPWDLWARIFQWLGQSASGQPWRVFWLAAEQPRQLPPAGQEVSSEHVNGGYCYPCKPDTIVVYRKEEATRVLIHELLHASCTDPIHLDLPMREATTETWAELYLVAVLSKGKDTAASKLWAMQSQWIADQNAQLQRNHDVYLPSDYAWRYTVGREYILEQLRINLPTANVKTSRSARFTSPALLKI
jgi:hypothetical protein